MNLGEFLRDHVTPAVPWNCSTLAADWCLALGHPDFAAAWREITDPIECEVTAQAGLLALWDIGIGDRLPAVTDLEPGDIAVVALGPIEAGAIWTGERFAIRTQRGLHFTDSLTVLKAWRP